MLPDENDIRSRLRSSKPRTAVAAASNTVPSGAPEPRRTRGRAGSSKNRTDKPSAGRLPSRRYRSTAKGPSVNKASKAPESAPLPGNSAMARPTPRPTRKLPRPARKLPRPARKPAATKTSAPAPAAVEDYLDFEVDEDLGNPIIARRGRPMRACTVRPRTGSTHRPLGNTLPPVNRLPEFYEDSSSESTDDETDDLEATKERNSSPVHYPDGDFVSSLYVDLASDEDIARFLLEPDSGFANVEQGDEMDPIGESARQRDDASGYPERGDEEGAQSREEGSTRPVTYPRGRWTQVPEPPASASRISASLLPILQRIMERLGEPSPPGVSRTIVDTSCTGEYKTRPDIVIQASGPSFELPSTPKQRILQAGSGEETRAFMDLGYTNAISVIEVRQESTTFKDQKCVAQLTAFCSEILANQPNRLFVRALLMTGTTVRLVHCDRGGTYVAPAFNYHTNPHVFVRLVLGLTSTDENVLGLDTSVHWTIDPASGKKVSGTILTKDEHKNEVIYDMASTAPRHHAREIGGRGTTCWSVRNPKGGRDLVIKDTWRAGDGAPECDFLEVVRGLPGVVKMISSEDNLGDTNDFCPAFYRRLLEYENRKKVRTVMEAYGHSILNYKSRYQLVAALKDAIRGHHELVKQRVLHRDVSAGNILLGDDDDQEGPRGLLVDLNSATHMDNDGSGTAPASNTIVGTRMYQSISTIWNYSFLQSKDPLCPHDYLDDLESFFYVLCRAMYSRVSEGKSLSGSVAHMFETWGEDRSDYGESCKVAFIHTEWQRSHFDLAYWGRACRKLLTEFRVFLKDIVSAKDEIWWGGDNEVGHERKIARSKDLGRDMEKHYLHIDTIFQEALDALVVEEPEIEAHLWSLAIENAPPVSVPTESLKRDRQEIEDDNTEGHPASKRQHQG